MTADFVEESKRIIEEAVKQFSPIRVYGLFSGGHDSLCATHLVSQTAHFDGAVHINTGIGIEETRQFVRDTCEQMGWPLDERHPPT
jgi:3'-phosphoadenosine 5'-phosphosulfate sulfotransferase (PAPS reductase)/FAD synthetase